MSVEVAKKRLDYWTLIRYTGLHIESHNNNHREGIATDIGIEDTEDTDSKDIGIEDTEESVGRIEESAERIEESAERIEESVA